MPRKQFEKCMQPNAGKWTVKEAKLIELMEGGGDSDCLGVIDVTFRQHDSYDLWKS